MKIGSYGHVFDDGQRGKAPWTIYHNPRCSKSREALDLLRANGIDPHVIYYLETPPNALEIKNILSLLQASPKEIIRTKEKIFSTLKIDLENAEDIVQSIAKHPELLERPIIIRGKKAVIGRPPGRALELVD